MYTHTHCSTYPCTHIPTVHTYSNIHKSIVGITKQFFSDVEDRLGRVFTRSALGYITASRDGLTEMELLDVLSCDDEV